MLTVAKGIVFRHQFQRTHMHTREFPAYSHCYRDKIELLLTYAFSSNDTTALFRLNAGVRKHMRKDMSKCFDEISKATCKVGHPLTIPYMVIRSVRLRLNRRHLWVASRAEEMELILACNPHEVNYDVKKIYTNDTSDSWNFRRIGRHWADNRRWMISVLSSAAALCEAIDELREAMASFWSRLSDKEKSSEMTAIHTQLARGLKEERAQLDSIASFTRQLEQRMHALESSVSLIRSGKSA